MTPEQIVTQGISGLISLLIGFGGSYVAFRIFMARVIARMEEWRTRVDEDIHELKAASAATELALIKQSLARLELAVGGTNGGLALELHQLKNHLCVLIPGYAELRNKR